jgi:hypothetical protein
MSIHLVQTAMPQAAQSKRSDDVSVASVTRSWRIRCLTRACRVQRRDFHHTTHPTHSTTRNTLFCRSIQALL